MRAVLFSRFVLSVVLIQALVPAIAAQDLLHGDRRGLQIQTSVRVAAGLEAASPLIKSRLEQAVDAAGMSAATDANELALFVADAQLVPVSSDVARTPVAVLVSVVELAIVVRNAAAGTSFGSFNRELRGTGGSAAEASRGAARQLGPRDEALIGFFRSTGGEIVRYFEANCTTIIERAESLALQKSYSDAIAALSVIPVAASECHSRSVATVDKLVLRQQEEQCTGDLRALRARWAADRSRESANRVAEGIGYLQAGLPCDADVDRLLGQVSSTIAGYDAAAAQRAREAREFRRKQYEDARSFALTREGNRHDERLAGIEAARTVGVEVAKAFSKRGQGWLAVFR